MTCTGGSAPAQYFVGFIATRARGCTTSSRSPSAAAGQRRHRGIGHAYFTENPGDPFKAWDTQVTFDWMPSQYITFRAEFVYRHASVPAFNSPGGVTPPGGNQGAPRDRGITDAAGNVTVDPDLVKDEPRFTLAMMVDAIFILVTIAFFALCVICARTGSDLTWPPSIPVGLIVAVLVTAYLVYALLEPERF